MGARRASVAAVAAVVGGVLLMTRLVTWAASIGPGGVLTGDGVDPVRVTPTATESNESPTDGTTVNDVERVLERTPGDNGLLRLVAVVPAVIEGTSAVVADLAWRKPGRGPGTLDEVMRRLARRAQQPRVVTR